MPSLANPLQGMALATFGTKNLLTPEIGSDIFGKQSSLANPWQISGAATYGTKPADGNRAYFSVGTAGDYKIVNPYTSIVTITIVSAIATFSFPQLHPYIGVGDKVSWSGGYGFLRRKILPNQWYIVDEFGVPKPNMSAINIISITKVFNSLVTAISGATPGLNSLLGSFDLKALDVQPNITCYNMSETGELDIQDLWTIDASRYIAIYSPFDKIYECNVPQNHLGFWGYGYNLSSTTDDTVKISQDRLRIEGLQLTTTAGSGIHFNSSTYHTIERNLIKDCSVHGIHDNNDVTNRSYSRNYIVANTIYDCSDTGIWFGKDEVLATEKVNFIYSNTIRGCDKGIRTYASKWGLSYRAYLKDNICDSNTTKDYDFNYPDNPPPAWNIPQTFTYPFLLHRLAR